MQPLVKDDTPFQYLHLSNKMLPKQQNLSNLTERNEDAEANKKTTICAKRNTGLGLQ